MTDEQTEDLFLQLQRLHPAEEKDVFRDPEFEQEQAAMEEEARGVLWSDTQIVPHGESLPEPAVEEEWEEMTDWDYRQLAKQLKS